MARLTGLTGLRGGWPLVLLLIGIGVTALAAVQAYRITRSQGAVLDGVLADYAEFASWSYEQHLEDRLLRASQEILGPVNHGAGLHESPRIPHAAEVGHFLGWDDSCPCHVPRYGPIPEVLLGFTLGSDTVGVGPNRLPEADRGWRVDTHMDEPAVPPAAAVYGDRYAWVNDSLTARTRAGYSSLTRFPYLIRNAGSNSRLLSYTLMPTVRGDTIIYAALYSAAAMKAVLDAVLDGEDLLPPALTERFDNREMLVLEVTAPDGTVLFGTDEMAADWALDSDRDLAPDFGGLRVRIQIRPAVAGTLVIGGVPRSQLPLLLALLGLAAAMTIVAVGQLVREGQLAHDRSAFVASVSHELRTPLAQIRLFLDTLRLGRADTPEARTWSLDQMDRETRRLGHLVDNVLVFSRGADRLLSEPRQDLELRAEAGIIVSEFAPLAASKRASVQVAASDDVVVRASRDILRHVLLNLLDNAVKYGPAGQTVTVRVRREAGCGIIDVIDQGAGVPAAERTRIWEAFARGDAPAARAAGGSGIGLHLVRELAAGLGGAVAVADAPDGGAMFSVRLPVAGAWGGA